jgi:hypothetical protein
LQIVTLLTILSLAGIDLIPMLGTALFIRITAMAISPLSDTALQGIQRGMRQLRRNAADIASANQLTAKTPTKDAVRALVELHQSSLQTSASVKAFKTADTLIGSLLDVKA